jgi:putative ABC transport system substrate-binding protein
MPFDQLHRRQFITLLGGAAAAWPLAARAQQSAMPIIGFLNGGSAWEYADVVAAFRQGLREAGRVEDQNLRIEYRWAEGHYERLPTLAAELVNRRVTAIAASAPAAVAAKAVTTSIPIVFVTAADQVEIGLVRSLNRPGGNLTGMTLLSVQLAPKKLQILHELLPATKKFALLVNPANGNAEIQSREVRGAAAALGLELEVLYAKNERDLDIAFAWLSQLQIGAVVIGTDGVFNSEIGQLADLSMRHRVNAIFHDRKFTASGGLMSYGASLTDTYRQAGVYVGRILNGESPSDLPVQQATKIELIINLKTAKALGLEVPPMLLARADEVIE